MSTRVRPETADAAAEWLTRIMSGEMEEAEYRQWQHWREADPDHERAWQQIESFNARLRNLQPRAAYQSLSAASPASPERRKLLGALLLIGAVGGAGVVATRTRSWHQIATDYRAGVGEQREFRLADGTQMLLNTRSAVDVRFDSQRRLLQLHTGEVMVSTGHRARDAGLPEPPLFVQTRDGLIRALGTRFIVRQHDDNTQVTVTEHAVEVVPAASSDATRLVQAGESVTFTRNRIAGTTGMNEQTLGWTRGQLIAADQRLADFLVEVNRYRRGVLRCDPAVADLRFSGVFPLTNPEQILALLPNSLPVSVRQLTRYWVIIEPA